LDSGLPDGIFSKQKYQFGIWYILWPSGIFCGHLVYFVAIWYFVTRKIWQPWLDWILGCQHAVLARFKNLALSNCLKNLGLTLMGQQHGGQMSL
jgi:hypothetical protein